MENPYWRAALMILSVKDVTLESVLYTGYLGVNTLIVKFWLFMRVSGEEMIIGVFDQLILE